MVFGFTTATECDQHMNRCLLVMLAAASLLCTVEEPLEAQTEISARAATIRLGGRLHSQYQGSSVDGAINDFFIRRARIIGDLTFNDFITGRVQTDFAKGTATLLDAYVRMNFDESFRLSFGQFKRAFDLFELSSSTDLSVFERTGKIAGYDQCAGVGGVCSLSQFTEELGYSERDMGVKIDGSSGTFSYQATLTNGVGVVTPDENDGKTVAGRGSVAATDNLTVSGNISIHDYIDPMAETAHAFAWGADVELGTWRDGLHIQAGVIGGDNWEVLDASDNPESFLTAQVIASYYNPIDNDRIVGVEPVLRVSIGDPNGSAADDGGTLITPGLMLYFMGKNRVGASIDYYSPQTGDSEFSFRVGTFLYF